MGVFQKQRRKGKLEVGEGSLQLQCGFRTVLADVGRPTTAGSLSLWRFSKPGTKVGAMQIIQEDPEGLLDTEPRSGWVYCACERHIFLSLHQIKPI